MSELEGQCDLECSEEEQEGQGVRSERGLLTGAPSSAGFVDFHGWREGLCHRMPAAGRGSTGPC